MESISPRPERTLRYHAKVRTGCFTCKKRKVKCDEEKPHCHRCVSTGRQCGGYRSPPQSPPSNSDVGGVVASHAGLFALSAERRSFSYFLSHACKFLGGYFNASFWGREVMQAAIHDAPIRHLIIAVGAAYESYENGTPEQTVEFTLRQSNQSIRHLAALSRQFNSLDSSVKTTCRILTASVLFIYLASIRGQFAEAFQHVHHAVKVLGEFERSLEQGSGKMAAPYPVPVAQLRALLAAAYGQLRIMINDVTPLAGHRDILVTDLEPATIFTSVAEAHAYVERLLHNMLAFLQDTSPSSLLSEERLEATVARHKELCVALDSSERALNMLASRHKGSADTHDQDGIAVLRVYHLMLSIRLRIDIFRPGERESLFDEEEVLLEQMLRHCESLVEYQQDQLPRRPSCSSGLGLLMPLHMIAARCRNPRLRRRALELLSSCPRREGLWDATYAARVATQTVQMEEAAALAGRNVTVPVHSRVHEVRLELKDEKTCLLRFVTVDDWKNGRGGSERLVQW